MLAARYIAETILSRMSRAIIHHYNLIRSRLARIFLTTSCAFHLLYVIPFLTLTRLYERNSPVAVSEYKTCVKS